jgi:hypothetical protein
MKKNYVLPIVFGVMALFVYGLTLLFALIGFVIIVSDASNTNKVIYLGQDYRAKPGFRNQLITNYNTYAKYFDDDKLTRSSFKEYDYYIFYIGYDSCNEKNFEPKYDKKEDVINVYYDKKCEQCYGELTYKYYAVRFAKGEADSYYQVNYVRRNKVICPYEYAEDKPMIYLYPEKDMNVKVTLGHKELLTTSYPKYENGWNVYAKTNGDLLLNGRTYYGLYWQGKKNTGIDMSKGFVVKGEDTAKFLEEKLSILGLTEREANEFIVYWLPKMEHNKYNFIRFNTREEIDEYMPLEVSPKPDTVIRVYIEIKSLSDRIEVEEQKIEKSERKGFTVVEWGGTIYE